MFKFDIEVTGEPAPTVTWQYNNEKVTNERVVIEDEPNLTSFHLKKPERSDTGIYKITAVNDSGTDTADLDLIVIGENYFINEPVKYMPIVEKPKSFSLYLHV